MEKYKTEFRLQIVNSFLAGDGSAISNLLSSTRYTQLQA